MIIEFAIIGQLLLALFNIGNAYIDAYRIMKDKSIAHAINFVAYLVFAIILCFVLGLRLYPIILFMLSAFFNRQFSFDIPLNLRRGLAWNYQSVANPPKALLDRIERLIFGTGPNVGDKIFNVYLACYVAIINIGLWTL